LRPVSRGIKDQRVRPLGCGQPQDPSGQDLAQQRAEGARVGLRHRAQRQFLRALPLIERRTAARAAARQVGRAMSEIGGGLRARRWTFDAYNKAPISADADCCATAPALLPNG
jgi:hypothetical protein